jgi:hypothetical protein
MENASLTRSNKYLKKDLLISDYKKKNMLNDEYIVFSIISREQKQLLKAII